MIIREGPITPTPCWTPKHCEFCNKKFTIQLFVNLKDCSRSYEINMCYACQDKIYGLEFNKNTKSFIHSTCYFCDRTLLRKDLFDKRPEFYIFTDMADSSFILFCSPCFKEASPKW
jgi:hypothetical protein